ncbi:hypothetical protein V7S43_018718 [Phytophthora oleae]|uniref:Uncharacterized protein n=1 Tax=Phytophthora oleae TaxID=2107226 RepID=A0ABD3EPQ3_9STRA
MLLGDSNGVRYTPFVILKAPAARTARGQDENLHERRGFGARVWSTVAKINKALDIEVYGNPKDAD